MKITKLVWWAVPLGLAVVLGLSAKAGILPWGKQTDQQATAPAVVSVAAVPTHMVSKVPVLQLTGSLEGQTSAEVSAKIGGRIEQVLVEDGLPVQAGQPLVRLESQEAANALRIAEDNARKAQINLENIQMDVERYRTLFNQSAISRQQLDGFEVRVKLAQADLTSAYAAVSNAQQQYSYTVIAAPVEGVVAHKAATVGQVVAAGMTLMTVENISSVYGVVHVEQQDMAVVAPGLQAEVTVDTYGSQVFPGTVAIINPAATNANRMFRVKVQLDNRQGKLKPGMFVKVRLVTGQETTVLAVPQAALLQKNGLFYVYVVDNGKAIRRQVEPGQTIGDDMEIKAGLAVNMSVIVTNVNKLKDGDAIAIAR